MPRACPVCGSRKWRKSGGVATCEEGHVLQGYRTEEAVLTEIGQHQLHRRRLRQTGPKARRRQVGEKDPDVFEGEAKHYLRLELFQLMLRHQLAAVQKAWGVPKEIEVIARDLWILALEVHPTPEPPIPPADDDEEQHGQAGPGPSTTSIAAQKQSAYPSGSASQPLPSTKKRTASQSVISEDPVQAEPGDPTGEPKKRGRGRPLGQTDSKPRRPGRHHPELRASGKDEMPKKKRGRPLGRKTTKKKKVTLAGGADFYMDATDEDDGLDEDDLEDLTNDEDWTDEDIDIPDKQDDQKVAGEPYMVLDQKPDDDDGDIDNDEYDYGDSEREIESDLLERLSAFSDDDSVSSQSSLESILIEGTVKVPFSNGNVHHMDKDVKGRFISTSGFPYGVKQSTNLKWSSGRHVEGVSAETVVHILVLSLWMMRIPIMMIDIMRAMDDGTLPYIEFGRSTYIPDPIKPHMSIDLLSGGTWAKRSPSVYFFWERLKPLADHLAFQKGIRFPELNAAPVLWRLVTTLGGGPVIYLVAYQILQILDISLTISRPEHYHDGRPHVSASSSRASTPAVEPIVDGNLKVESVKPVQVIEDEQAVEAVIKSGKKWRGPKRRQGTSGVIEVRLVAAVLIAFKLVYGLDGVPRVPVTADDPAVGLPVATEWVAEMERKLKAGWFKRGAVEAVPIDFARSENVDVDDFLARAEQFLLSSRSYPAHLRNTKNLADLFPLYPQADLARPHDMTDLAIAAWADFNNTSNKIDLPDLLDIENIPEGGRETLPVGARVRTYIAGRVDKPTMGAIKLPRSLRTVIDATSQIIGIRPIHIIQQMSLMERTLYWAQRPWRSKRFPVTPRWAKHREQWEFRRRNLRAIVEQTRWDDEDDDSDLRSWHSSESDSD